MRRTPLARGAALLRRTGMVRRSPVSSAPSATERRQRALRRRAYAVVDGRSGGQCEALDYVGVSATRCRDLATEHHHRRPRGMGGSGDGRTELASNLIGTCRWHHRQAESWRTSALSDMSGWLVPHGVTDPADVPVLLWCGWVLLRDDGTTERTDG